MMNFLRFQVIHYIIEVNEVLRKNNRNCYWLSFNELNYNLEQWRALDANMSIGACYVKNVPLSVDTEEDLKKVESIIKISND